MVRITTSHPDGITRINTKVAKVKAVSVIVEKKDNIIQEKERNSWVKKYEITSNLKI